MKKIFLHGCAIVLTFLVACSSPPKPPPMPAALLKGATLVPAKLQAGCLLPDPALLTLVQMPASVRVNIKVSAAGRPTEVRVLDSTGQAALDEAFANAARNCSFAPATANGIPADYWYALNYAWAPGQSFAGPTRCFPLPYPREALRKEESDTVQVRFRIRADGGALETKFTSARHSPLLTPLSVSAVEKCLAHSEARQGLAVGQWYSITYDWRIED